MKLALLLLLLLTGCAAKKPVKPAAHTVIPPNCRREVEYKACHPEAKNPDWCDGQYRMHFVCVKVIP